MEIPEISADAMKAEGETPSTNPVAEEPAAEVPTTQAPARENGTGTATEATTGTTPTGSEAASAEAPACSGADEADTGVAPATTTTATATTPASGVAGVRVENPAKAGSANKVSKTGTTEDGTDDETSATGNAAEIASAKDEKNGTPTIKISNWDDANEESAKELVAEAEVPEVKSAVTVIEDEEVPLAKAPTDNNNYWWWWLLLLLLIVITIHEINKEHEKRAEKAEQARSNQNFR